MKVAHESRVTSVQVAEEMRLAFFSNARPARGGVSVRSLQQGSNLLTERAFLPVPGDATTVRYAPSTSDAAQLSLSRLVPSVAVAHDRSISMFDIASLKTAPVATLHGKSSVR